MHQPFNRIKFLIISCGVVSLGLLTRKMSAHLPDIVNLYLGDILWALMVYFLVKVIFPTGSISKIAILSLTFCFLIEASQLYQADWINMVRRTTLGGLVLGYGFLWSDILAYFLGICLGIFLDQLLRSAIFNDRYDRNPEN